MITYVKNIMYPSPEVNFLNELLKKYEIVGIGEVKLSFKADTVGDYMQQMPKGGLNISISGADLSDYSREIGVCDIDNNNIWVYYPSTEDFNNSPLKNQVNYEYWRNKIAKNVLFHELIEYFSVNKTHKDFENMHNIKSVYSLNNCVSVSNLSFFSTFEEILEYAYNKEICPFCERKINLGLKEEIMQ